jgi:(E)-4-hydroxy-3-methyl-but-2-enyl pyrophosphate reductase
MKVRIARTSGFCMGVRKAVNLTLDAARDHPRPITTLGPLIHNPQVVDMLEKRGVGSAREIPDSGTVVIRSHGVAPSVREEIKEKGLDLFDATCPRVSRVHGLVSRQHRKGYTIVVLGDEGHAEVDGIKGCADGEAIVIRGPADAEDLPDADRVCLVSQTTQEMEVFEEVAAAVRERYRHLPPESLVIVNTICDSTRTRHEEVRELSRGVEAMVVVGGRNSANTRRLAKVAEEEGLPTFLVESEEDLDRRALSKFNAVGLTAGASTPNWMIRRIYEELQTIEAHPGALGKVKAVVKWLIMSNTYIAMGAGFMTFAAAGMQGFRPLAGEVAVSTLFVFAVHTITLLADSRALALNVPQRATSFSAYRRGWIGASLAALSLAFVTAFTLGLRAGIALTVLGAGSFLYSLHVSWKGASRLPLRALFAIPAGKDLFMAGGWAALIVILPLVHAPERSMGPFASLTALVTVFGLVFVRALLRDFRDLQADRLIGKETLPLVLGAGRTRSILLVLILLLALVNVLSTHLGWVPAPLGYAMLLPIAYTAACVPLFTRQTIVQAFGAELVIDATFIIAGLTALLT